MDLEPHEQEKDEWCLTEEEMIKCEETFRALVRDEKAPIEEQCIDVQEVKALMELMGHRGLSTKDLTRLLQPFDIHTKGCIDF